MQARECLGPGQRIILWPGIQGLPVPSWLGGIPAPGMVHGAAGRPIKMFFKTSQ